MGCLNPTSRISEQLVFHRDFAARKNAIVIHDAAYTTFKSFILSYHNIIILHIRSNIGFRCHQDAVQKDVHISTIVINDDVIPLL